MRAQAERVGMTLNSLGSGPDMYFWRKKPSLGETDEGWHGKKFIERRTSCTLRPPLGQAPELDLALIDLTGE